MSPAGCTSQAPCIDMAVGDLVTQDVTYTITSPASGYYAVTPQVCPGSSTIYGTAYASIALDGVIVASDSMVGYYNQGCYVGSGAAAAYVFNQGHYGSFRLFGNATSVYLYDARWLDLAPVQYCSGNIWYPDTDPVTVTIVGGNKNGEFYKKSESRVLGGSFTALAKDMSDYGFMANGEDPDEAGGLVTLQATANGIASVDTFRVKRAEPLTLNTDLPDGTDIFEGSTSTVGVYCRNRDNVPSLPGWNSTYTFSIIEGSQWATLVDINGKSGTSLDGIPSTTGIAQVWLCGIGEHAESDQQIRVRVHATNSTAADIECTFNLYPEVLPRMLVTATPPSIAPGDTALITLKELEIGGVLQDYSPDTRFDVRQVFGFDTYGYFLSPEGDTGYGLNQTLQGFKFIAYRGIQTDSAKAVFTVHWPNAGGGGGAASIAREDTSKKGQHAQMSMGYSSKASAQKSALAPEAGKTGKPLSSVKTGSSGARIMGPANGLPQVGVGTVDFGAEFDHFGITIVPDTLASRDTVAFTECAKLYVQAKDKGNRDVQIDGNSLLTFSLESNLNYGTFIGVNGDTLKTFPVELKDVKYADANGGKVKFAAVVLNPQTEVLTGIRVVLQSDPTKRGDRDIVVIEKTLKIVMDPPFVVRPLIPQDRTDSLLALRHKPFQVRLTRGGKPVGDHEVRIVTAYVAGSGGHDHTDTGVRRANTIDNYGYFVDEDNETYNPYFGSTNSNGLIPLTFYSSVWGDTMWIMLQSLHTPLLNDSLAVSERVVGLIQFSETGQFELTGRVPNHMSNHYFRSQVAIDDLINAANEFAQQEWNNTGVMRLNDMSLPFGGLFDVNGQWDTVKGHRSHRIGRSVDIENLYLMDIDTVSQKTGKDTILSVPEVPWVRNFVDFMENQMSNWQFSDEGQQRSNVYRRTKKYPHFEWTGE